MKRMTAAGEVWYEETGRSRVFVQRLGSDQDVFEIGRRPHLGHFATLVTGQYGTGGIDEG